LLSGFEGSAERSDPFSSDNLSFFMGAVGVVTTSGTTFLWEGRGRFSRFCEDVDPTLSTTMGLSGSFLCEFASWVEKPRMT